MSVTDHHRICGTLGRPSDPACQHYPSFALDWAVDDPDAPNQVTVSPAAPDDPLTEWLSVDIDHAVPLDELR